MIVNNLKNKNIVFWIKWSVAIILFLIIGVFAYFNMSGIFLGVNLKASMTKPGINNLSSIEGKAKNASVITLNGREIKIDKSGNFHEDLALPEGYSMITIEARDALGKTSRKTIPVYAKDSSNLALAKNGSNITN